MAQPRKFNVPVVAPAFKVKRGAPAPVAGLGMPKIAIAVFDPSANTAQRPIGANNLGVFLPAKAIVTRVFIDVVTTFTSATDAATIALSAQSANDIVAAIAISNASNVWDAGVRGSKVGTYALDGNALTQIAMGAAVGGAMLKLTAEREIVATTAVEALTAGKALIYVEYIEGV